MVEKLTIGTVARRTGVPIDTIRFYEAEGIIPPPARTAAGYRLFTPTDVRRLRLVRHARLLGLSLPEVKALADQAFQSACAEFADQLLDSITAQRRDIDRRMAECPCPCGTCPCDGGCCSFFPGDCRAAPRCRPAAAPDK